MTYVEADNILSPLGKTSDDNYRALLAGKSMLHTCSDSRGLLEDYTASLFSADQWNDILSEDAPTPFEALALSSIRQALQNADFDISSPRVILIISTTKGAVNQLPAHQETAASLYPGACAQRIATRLGITTKPVVVCNACISGLAAVILAQRLLDASLYDHAIVCGADCQGDFIISGFQSLKALSPTPCRPFDMERNGLNLGEAAATLILGSHPSQAHPWAVTHGAIRNDAYHVTTPSRQAEGLSRSIAAILQDKDKNNIGLINLHGTATLFNDQMESIAIRQLGLSSIPANALKGYYGHTMGAAGVLETILTMHAVDDHTVLGTRGFEELGVSGRINLSAENRPTKKTSFLKVLSGFGGGNAAIHVTRKTERPSCPFTESSYTTTHTVTLSPHAAEVDGRTLEVKQEGAPLPTAVYRQFIHDYPKYYKMDALSRLGFVAAELLLQAERQDTETEYMHDGDRAVILFNRSSSICSDKQYLASIQDKDNFYPSPSVFVYTLPNIVTGEIAIRNRYHGETSFFVLPERDEALETDILKSILAGNSTKSAIAGWLDYEDDTHFLAHMHIIEQEQRSPSSI